MVCVYDLVMMMELVSVCGDLILVHGQCACVCACVYMVCVHVVIPSSIDNPSMIRVFAFSRSS